MKTQFLLTLASLLLLAANCSAQPLGVTINLAEEMSQVSTRVANRTVWNNGSMIFTIGYANFPEYREAWNISDEQHRQIEALRQDQIWEYRESPEYREIEEERDQAMSDPFIRNADERTRMDVFLEYEERLSMIREEFRAAVLDELLTAEQKQMIREYELAEMANAVFFPVASLEALDLTDDQRQQINTIKQEFEPEFETMLEDYVDKNGSWRTLGRKYYALVEQMGYDSTKYHIVHNKLMAEDPEYERLQEKQTSQRERFQKQFMAKTFDVLTDEQWDRLQKLIDDPPEHVKSIRKRRAAEAEQTSGWQPGPGSWRPGDPIPEQYRQERKTRRGFPREE